MPHSSSSSLLISKSKRQNFYPSNLTSFSSCCNPTSFSSCCNHSYPVAILDLLILIPSSSSSAPFSSSPLSPTSSESSPKPQFQPQPSTPPFLSPPPPLPLLRISQFCFRKCRNLRCKGLKKALEFDVQIQTEDCVREKGKEIEDLPWEGVQQGRNPDFKVLRAELRKMEPVNGRAVLLFRARCGVSAGKVGGLGAEEGAEAELEARVRVLALQVQMVVGYKKSV